MMAKKLPFVRLRDALGRSALRARLGRCEKGYRDQQQARERRRSRRVGQGMSSMSASS